MSEGFDLRTHILDAKTGEVLKVQPYRLVVKGDKKIFIRDGVEYYEDGTRISEPTIVPPVELKAKANGKTIS